MTNEQLINLAYNFSIEGDALSIEKIGEGHINKTYLLKTDKCEYILQSINNTVFKNIDGLMSNIVYVTEYLADEIKKRGGDPMRETLNVVPTKTGKSYYYSAEGIPFRVYYNIKDSFTVQSAEKPEDFASSAVAFGNFQKMLSGFDAGKLTETIPAFHNTKVRIFNLLKAMKDNKAGRLDKVSAECDFVLDRAVYAGKIVDAIESGAIPLRVTHNDTKLNNVLMDKNTGKCLCVVDLDTVMPGSCLYDFGDAIRFGASTASEDEPDLSKVHFDINLFEAFVKGYASVLADSITPEEVSLLTDSALIITLECGARFLTDYLDGDVYFGCAYPQHNLDRCHTHFKLVSEMEKNREAMDIIVRKYFG